MSIYSPEIIKIAQVLITEIEKHFPGLTKKTFDSFGHPKREGDRKSVV